MRALVHVVSVNTCLHFCGSCILKGFGTPRTSVISLHFVRSESRSFFPDPRFVAVLRTRITSCHLVSAVSWNQIRGLTSCAPLFAFG